MADLDDLKAFSAVARAAGFREAAKGRGGSASSLSEAVRRLEARLGVQLLSRSTRSVAPTEAGARLLERLDPALKEIEAALDVVNGFRDRPAGTLRLNVPVSAARLVLSRIVPPFLAAYPDIHLEVIAEDSFVDVLAAGCDAGIRYEERLENDMVAIPIGPRVQRFATAAAPDYLNRRGRPAHPRDLLQHACLRGRFASGAELSVDAALAGTGVIHLFEGWLQPYLDSGALEAVLEPWWQRFSGPFLYFPRSRYLPAPLRAFIDFARTLAPWA
jgi:DNA-binding transcriptional LysR family regulator